MKKNLEILDFEDKKTQKGIRYTRFKTNEGWMSCFNAVAYEALKDFEGKTACCDVIQKGDFLNIEKCYGEAESIEPNEITKWPDEKPEVVRPGGFTKGAIEGAKRIANIGKYEPTSMYVSYAKDVFVAMMEKATGNITHDNAKDTMNECIELVKQAKEAFE